MVGQNLAQDLKSEGIAVGLIHPGTVFTGILNTRTEHHHNVDESVHGVLQAIFDYVTLKTTGCYIDANYGQGVKTLPW